MDAAGHNVQRSALLAALPIVIALLAMSGACAAASKVSFNLPGDDFSSAILEFSHQSTIPVLYASMHSPQGIKTRTVVGEFEPSEALSRMLEGTGLEWQFDLDGAVLVRPRDSASGTRVAEARGESHPNEAAARRREKSRDPGELEEVIVTGSLIHGMRDVITPLQRIAKSDLQQASYATVQDALSLLPLTSLNAPREDLGLGGNLNRGAGINLRGLGTGATLVLVNGHRQPAGGFDGAFVDVSNIPWSAVERIEVLPDGSSALYGSDAVAGVVNIILRENLRGGETQARIGGSPGGAQERLVSQIFGMPWETGRMLLAYQYSDRTPLAAADRFYAADADKRPLGGGDHRSDYSSPGNLLDPRTLQPIYGIPPGRAGTALNPAERSSAIHLQNRFAHLQLFPARTSHHLYVTASQAIGGHAELFVEGRFARRETQSDSSPEERLLVVPRSNPFFVDPLGGSPYVMLAYSFARDLGAVVNVGETRNYVGTLGTKLTLGNGWQATLSETYGQETLSVNEYNKVNPAALDAALADPNPATAFNPFSDGSPPSRATLRSLRQTDRLHALSEIYTASAITDGPLVMLPAGTAKLALGIEQRRETFSHRSNLAAPQPFGRHAESAFAELSLPLVGTPGNPRAAPRLETALAGRFEQYGDFGHTFNPQFRLRWVPWESVKLRGSWGTSFRAPTLVDLHDTSNSAATLASFPDRNSPNGRSLVLALEGSNPRLLPETATTWTAGFDWAPVTAPGWSLSMTYYEIDYEGRMARPGPANPFDVLLQESEWTAVTTRNPTRGEIDAACRVAALESIRSACLASAPAAIIDLRLANLWETRLSGLDLSASAPLPTRFGNFNLGLNAAYTFNFDQTVSRDSRREDISNTVGGPLALRVRATVGWNQRPPDQPGLGLAVAINHTGAYRNPASSRVPSVHPWTTVDLQIRYRTAQGAWPAATEFSLNTVNLFNRRPPFVDTEYGYDVLNTQPLGRVVSLYVRACW